MKYKSIIITGTSFSGKTSIANKLAQDNHRFVIVKAITTRDPRADDTSYEYVDDAAFDELKNNDALLVDSEYRGKKYGIKISEYDTIKNDERIPIIVITSDASRKLLDKNSEFLCIFVDAPNDVLHERFIRRGSCTGQVEERDKEFDAQNKSDRANQNCAHYIIRNNDLSKTVELVSILWDTLNLGGGLNDSIIKQMISCDMLLDGADISKANGASYDLRLGDEYYYAGKINRLSDDNPFLTIEPYDYAIVSCVEKANMPRDVMAKFGLTVGLFCQGIILSNGPQVDPGFRGTLFCLLFNTSNRAVHLKRAQHYATIEFNKLIDFAEPYNGKYQDSMKIIDYIPANALHGAINELKLEIEALKNESRTMQNIYLGVCGLMFAVISILLVIQ